ncbi:unnamed protein product [Calicophoron daubneyi]|uniref:EF-hand domain-containing protein n=1 Tax=Calicophoron daubneyi TaxID=300641 RepID=A0AAV2TSF6_CALDB
MKVGELEAYDIAKIEKTFHMFAKKELDGLPSESLGKALRWLKLIPSEAQVEGYKKLADPEKTGTIKMEVFLAVAADLWYPSIGELERTLWNAFSVFDKDLTGTISAKTLRHILTYRGLEPIPQKEVEKLITQYEDPSNHMISYSVLIRGLMR